MSNSWPSLPIWLFAALPLAAQEGDPLSAIDWLSESVSTPASGTIVTINEPPVTAAGGALPQPVSTTALDAPQPDGVGLIAPEVSGLPRDLWGGGLTLEIAARLTADRAGDLPALRQLFLTILLAEVEAPADAGGRGDLLRVRIDKLLALGALEQAAALIQAAGATASPELFRRAFDVALLTGEEDRACAAMAQTPALAPTVPARIFCLARSGQWETATLTLQTAEALGEISADQATMLARFLDPVLFEGEAVPAAPDPVTPLDWKIYEAVGEPLGTDRLPVAFSYAEIGPRAGWKAQIEAAERLTRAGTIPPNVILGLYTEREAAASGGVWDRVEAFQEFEAALASGDPARIGPSLTVVWPLMAEAELEVPFAVLFGKALIEVPLTGKPAEIAFHIGLLSPQSDRTARQHVPETPTEAFLVGLATGDIAGLVPPDSLGRAVAQAFLNPAPSAEAQALFDANRKGEAILIAIENIGRGVEGDLRGVTEGLSLLRMVGLDSMARRTALELMLLERRG
ncbi:MAG: hypothetical protein B7Z31_09650 [Rhodobacterales bacterium 12-65-15]|nr:MAG: hypothetical protein B7Z31_09650 [Rhodobacterales bacterium 12-65-15]